VSYDRLQDTIECSFEGHDNDPLGEVLNNLRGNYKYDLLLEIRKEDAEFEVYQPGSKFRIDVCCYLCECCSKLYLFLNDFGSLEPLLNKTYITPH
jgi:hypothetical protein